jgi:hypothetical protein
MEAIMKIISKKELENLVNMLKIKVATVLVTDMYLIKTAKVYKVI